MYPRTCATLCFDPRWQYVPGVCTAATGEDGLNVRPLPLLGLSVSVAMECGSLQHACIACSLQPNSSRGRIAAPLVHVGMWLAGIGLCC